MRSIQLQSSEFYASRPPRDARDRFLDERSLSKDRSAIDEKSRSQPADPPENGTCRAAEGRGRGGAGGGQLSLRERAGNDEISFIRRRWSRLARRIANGNAPRNVRVSKARRINRRINRRILGRQREAVSRINWISRTNTSQNLFSHLSPVKITTDTVTSTRDSVASHHVVPHSSASPPASYGRKTSRSRAFHIRRTGWINSTIARQWLECALRYNCVISSINGRLPRLPESRDEQKHVQVERRSRPYVAIDRSRSVDRSIARSVGRSVGPTINTIITNNR